MKIFSDATPFDTNGLVKELLHKDTILDKLLIFQIALLIILFFVADYVVNRSTAKLYFINSKSDLKILIKVLSDSMNGQVLAINYFDIMELNIIKFQIGDKWGLQIFCEPKDELIVKSIISNPKVSFVEKNEIHFQEELVESDNTLSSEQCVRILNTLLESLVDQYPKFRVIGDFKFNSIS